MFASLAVFAVLIQSTRCSFDSDFTGLNLDNDGSYHAILLEPNEWSNASCTASGFRDFYVDTSASNVGQDNLFVEVVYSPGSDHKKVVAVDILSLYMFQESIPSDRQSENKQESSPDGVYSLAVNANEVEEGRYFVSVKCGEHVDGIVNFGVLAKFETAELQEAKPQPYLICPKEILYHYLTLTDDDVENQKYNVRFEMCVPVESQSILSLVTKVSHPPLRLSEPMVSLDASSTNVTVLGSDSDRVCVTYDVCNGALEVGKVWAGVFGAGLCGEYNISATFFGGTSSSGESCETEVGGASEEASTSSPIELEHVTRGSCNAYEWVDYELTLTDYDRENNLVFEVSDLTTGGLNPESLSVHLFTDSIPVDRQTENRAERSVSALYAVFKTFLSYSEMVSSDGVELEKVYVSVRCGPNPSSFKILGEHVTSLLSNGHSVRGEVCSGAWIYHYWTTPSDANATASLDVKLLAYEGYVQFTVVGSHPPVRIAPPYGTAGTTSVAKDVIICGVEADITYYVGVQIASGYESHCAVYDISATLDLNDVNCEAPRQAAPDNSFIPAELTAYYPYNDFVDHDDHKLYSIEIDYTHSHDNLLVEVELTVTTASSDLPNALEVMLFEGEVPTDGDYESPFFAAKGSSGLWSIAVSAHDLKQTTYFVVVRGVDVNQVRYRVVALLIESELEMGHRHHGEICEGEWLYFSFNAASLNSSTTVPGSRRRLLNQKEEMKTVKSRRLLASDNQSDDSVDKATTHGSDAIHLSIHVWRYSGTFWIRLAHGYAPIKLVPPFTWLGSNDTDITVDICDVGARDRVDPETVYAGVLGGSGCAMLDVVANTYVGGNCTEPRNFAEVDATEGALEMQLEHYTHASCTPGGYTDLYVTISEDHATDNMLFEVEQLGDQSDPTALTVLLYPDEIPAERASERRSDHATHGIYSVAMSSVDMHPGNFFLSVQCKDSGVQEQGGGGGERVRFRVAPLAIKRDLEVGHTQHGELCPLEWIHHRFMLNDTTHLHDDYDDESTSSLAYHVRIHVWKYVGDFYAMVSDHAPFKLMAPNSYLSSTEHELILDYCNIWPNEEVWVGLFGGEECGVYDVDLIAHNGECTNTPHETRRLAVIKPSRYNTGSSGTDDGAYRYISSSSSATAALSLASFAQYALVDDDDNTTLTLEEVLEGNTASELVPGHLHLSSCEANSWVDFYLQVGSDAVVAESSNIQFEVMVDVAYKANPTALSAYLHVSGTLPDDRGTSEIFSGTSTDGVISVAVPPGLVKETIPALFLSVQCGSVPVSFKAVAVVIPSQLTDDHHSFGEVCPGGWVYFHAETPDGSNHIRFDITKYEGSASFIARTDERPTRLTYPYVTLDRDGTEETTSVYSCDEEVGQTVYLGAKGESHCATFTVTPHFFSGDCSDETNVEHTFIVQEDTTVNLEAEVWQFGHCLRGGWAEVSFRETFTKGMDVNNVLVEVEALLDDDVLDSSAIQVYIFKGAAPPAASGRELYHLASSSAAQNNVHSILQSYVEVNKMLDELDDNEEKAYLSIAIKCSDEREKVRFRLIAHETKTELSTGHRYHGTVCPFAWVFHMVDATDTSTVEDDGAHRLRRLADSSEIKNVRFTLRILQGGVYRVAARLNNPPGFTSSNKVNLNLMAGEDPYSTVAFGHVVEYDITVCGVQGHEVYLGVFGDESGCALYDITAAYMDATESCTDGSVKVVDADDSAS